MRDLEHAEERMRDVKREGQPTDIPCAACGAKMVIKWGRSGEFLACPNYPKCKNTKNFSRDAEGTIKVEEAQETDEKCEQCGRPMLVRFGRYGKFFGCSGYPECKNVRPLVRPVPTGVTCPDCGAGRDHGKALAHRQDLLQLQPLPAVQIRHVGSAGAGALPAVQRAVRRREDHQTLRHRAPLPERRLQIPGNHRRGGSGVRRSR